MPRPEITAYDACSECFTFALTGDATIFETDARWAQVERGIDRVVVGQGHFAGAPERDDEFSSRPCEVCGDRHAGERKGLDWVRMR